MRRAERRSYKGCVPVGEVRDWFGWYRLPQPAPRPHPITERPARDRFALGLYVLLLRGSDGVPDEVRYHDRPLRVGRPVRVDGRAWIVKTVENTAGRLLDPSGAEVRARYICARADRV